MRNCLYINYPIQINNNLLIYGLKQKLCFLEKITCHLKHPCIKNDMISRNTDLSSDLIKGMIRNILMDVGM